MGGRGGECVGGRREVHCMWVVLVCTVFTPLHPPSPHLHTSLPHTCFYTHHLSPPLPPSTLPLLSLSSPSSPSFPLTTPKVNFSEPLSTSCYAANRVNKLFNPMLGETYECDRRAELGWRCFMEQVRVVCCGGGGGGREDGDTRFYEGKQSRYMYQ